MSMWHRRSADEDPDDEDPERRGDPGPERISACAAGALLGRGGGRRRKAASDGARRRPRDAIRKGGLRACAKLGIDERELRGERLERHADEFWLSVRNPRGDHNFVT